MWWIIATFILVGILLMLIEMLLIPGVGVAGFLSMASLVASCWYAFDNIGRAAGFITTGIVLVLLALSLAFMLRAKTWKRFELKTEVDSKVNSAPDKIRPGDRGCTLTRLAPMGTAMFGDMSCEVKSHDNTMIDPGTIVEVVRIDDNKVIVKSINQ